MTSKRKVCTVRKSAKMVYLENNVIYSFSLSGLLFAQCIFRFYEKAEFLFFPTILALAFGLMLSCAKSSSDDSSSSADTSSDTDTSSSSTVTLSGKVQKGPYVQGTEITVRELDSSMTPTGNTFTGTIDDNTGSFSIKGTLTNKIVELSADGYYFNEVSGSLSTGKLTLSALSDMTDSSSVNVNLMTHLEKKRVEYLMARTETKNLNSFRFVQQAVVYEIGRQREEILDGKQIVQETRLWDTGRKVTFSMRSKEEADEYRYFPDPDLPLVHLAPELIETFRKNIPELPDAKRQRFMEEHGLSEYDAEVLSADRRMSEYFEKVLTYGAAPKLACNWIIGDLTRVMNESGKSLKEIDLSPEHLAALTKIIDSGEISSKIAKTVFEEMLASARTPEEIIEEKGLKQVSDSGELGRIVDELLAANPEQVEQYRAGKTKVIGFFVGQMMKQTQGKGNPAVINSLLKEKLDG